MIKTVEHIMSGIDDDTLVIASTGIPSRVVYHVKDRPQNFYVMGSMGASLGIGIGLALNTKRKVVVIAGDGDILMNLGSLVLMNHLNLENLELHVLDNNEYAATGGQKTCSKSIHMHAISINVTTYRISQGKPNVGRIKLTPKEIQERFYNENNHL